MPEKITSNLNYRRPEDGVLHEATINARKNIHSGIVFSFRPPDFLQRKSFSLKITEMQNDSKYDEATKAEFVGTLERIEKWNMEVVTPQMFINGQLEMNAELFQDIYRVTWGFEAAAKLEVIAKNS